LRVYQDAAPVIYSVEQIAPFAAVVDARLALPGVQPIASDLTRMECKVLPLRRNDGPLLRSFEEFFRTVVKEIVPLTSDVLDRAAEIRARFGFKTPDAIHLAAAVVSGCDVFLTNDHRLDRFTGIAVETLQP
jgi:predicted nucleic acid-binding protein